MGIFGRVVGRSWGKRSTCIGGEPNNFRSVFPITPIRPGIVLTGVLGTTVAGVEDVAYRGRGTREWENPYQISQD